MSINRTVAGLLLLALIAVGPANGRGDDPVDLATGFDPLWTVDDSLPGDVKGAAGERKASHPLVPSLKIAVEGYQRIDSDVRDYTCVMVKREQVNGRLRGPELIFAKVRHERVEAGQVVSPFSVYLKFKAPERIQNREVLFVRGGADDKLLVRNGGQRLAFLTLAVKPNSAIAMTGNRYPITEFGIKRLIERMIMLGRGELAYEECEVTIRDDVVLDDHVCTCIEVKHPFRRPHFQYHWVKIFIDNKLRVPIRFESYDWPETTSDQPVLKEEYTYRDLKLNVGLTDADFDRGNPEYQFR